MKPFLRVAIVVAVAVALPACSSDKPAPETARQTLERLAPSREGDPLQSVAVPAAYKITYLRVNAASKRDSLGRAVPTRLTRSVVRPFTSTVTGELQRRLGFDQDAPNSSERVTFLRPLPEEARPDVYPPAAGHDAQRNRSVAGRTCRVYLYDDNEYCLDNAGLVLASRVNGTVEIATRVVVEGDAPSAEAIAASLAAGFTHPTKGSVRPIDPSSSPPGRTDWSLPATPDGFTFVGRYTVVPLTGALIEEGNRAILAGVADVYVRGIDTIVVDRGGKFDTTAVTPDDLGSFADAHDVDLGALGTGKAGIGGIGPFGYREVRAIPEKGRYVVVSGTLPLDELVALTRTLRPSPGATLRYLDGH